MDDACRCELGLAGLAFFRSDIVAHDGPLIPFVVDLGGKLKDDPLYHVPLHRIRPRSVQVVQVCLLQVGHVLELEFGHHLVDDGLFRLEVHAAFEDAACLISL